MPEQTRPRLVKKQVVRAAEILGDDPAYWEQSSLAISPETRLRVIEITEPGDEHRQSGFYKAGRTVRLEAWGEDLGDRPSTSEPFALSPEPDGTQD